MPDDCSDDCWMYTGSLGTGFCFPMTPQYLWGVAGPVCERSPRHVWQVKKNEGKPERGSPSFSRKRLLVRHPLRTPSDSFVAGVFQVLLDPKAQSGANPHATLSPLDRVAIKGPRACKCRMRIGQAERPVQDQSRCSPQP